MKLKVLLVDDEPFILQGLSVLVDWEAEGYEIAKTAANGGEALEFLLYNRVDLIIADIRMPMMTGIELLGEIREKNISAAQFIILSGYNDFQYVQKALRYSCMDYILKPVQKESLLALLRQAVREKEIVVRKEADREKMEKAHLAQNLMGLLRGRYEQATLDYIGGLWGEQKGVRYIHICFDNIAALEELSDEELRTMRKRLFQNCLKYLSLDGDHCFEDMPGFEEDYEIGFVYCDKMAERRGMGTKLFLAELQKKAEEGKFRVPIILLAGKRVEDIGKISHSYSSACILRSFRSFRSEKSIYYYEEEVQVNQGRIHLCKQNLDRLIQSVEQNDRVEINSSVDDLFLEMKAMGMMKELISMNTNYLLFQLIHLAVEQDESVNQEEVMLYISENVFDAAVTRGGRAHLRRFACEYANYLIQLRKNVSRGVLLNVEKEIKERFAENLTLRELGQKYFINSSYLGQIFRKKYGQSFKDYLGSYRISEAAQQLLKTDKKVSQIVEEVGYHDTDYFINKFIELKGCTPSRYRKNNGDTGG